MSAQAAAIEIEPFCYVEHGDPREVAEACRVAGLAFVNGVARGWRRTELARWLVGPYARAACGTHTEESEHAALPLEVTEESLQRLLFDVRDQVVRAISDTPDGLVRLPTWARTAGSAIRCQHANGEEGWVPVDWSRMRLVDRVLSLFACDALLRPGDYETKLAICGRCATVSFDEKARARGLCEIHAGPTSLRSSGVRLVAEAIAAERRARLASVRR